MCYEIYKTKNELNAAYMKDIFETRPSRYPSRKPENLYMPRANQITYGYNSYRIQGPKLWNFLPSNIKQLETIEKFKDGIKTLEMPYCSCEKCLTIQTRIGGSKLIIVDKMLQEILANK